MQKWNGFFFRWFFEKKNDLPKNVSSLAALNESYSVLLYFELARIYPFDVRTIFFASQRIVYTVHKNVQRIKRNYSFGFNSFYSFVFSNTNQSLSVCLVFWIEFKSFVWKTPCVCVYRMLSFLFDKKSEFSFRTAFFMFLNNKENACETFRYKIKIDFKTQNKFDCTLFFLY